MVTGWIVGVRGTIVASLLVLSGGAIAMTAGAPARAESAELEVEYRCTGGIAGSVAGGVRLLTQVSVPATVNAGAPLNIGWKVAYPTAARFGAPDWFAAGAKVSVTGDVTLAGAWVGVLRPTGSLKQESALQKDSPLTLPAGISDSAHTDRPGTLKITPEKLVVDFMPPAGKVMVNDNELTRIKYEGPGDWQHEATSAGQQDHNNDRHVTNVLGASALFEFTGTGIDYVGPRFADAGPVAVQVDDKEPVEVFPGKENGSSVTGYKGGQDLFASHDLPYGPHKIKIVAEGPTRLDAFRVHTKEQAAPPEIHRSVCEPVSAPGSLVITIGARVTPSVSGSASITPTTPVTVTPTATRTATVTATPKPTSTVTATATPQVRVTPKGAAQTGEAPLQERSGAALIGAGGVLLTGGVLGGVALRRRRAAHATGRADSDRG
jgi:hypothetical protein